jgi:O-antigen/teichoic acid export membrane protein
MIFVGIVANFLGLNVEPSVGVYFFRMERDQFKVFLGNLFVIWFFSTLGILIFVYLLNDSISILVDIKNIWLLIGVVLVSAQFIITLNLHIWQCEQNAKNYGTYQFFQMALNISLTLILIVHFEMGWAGRLLAIVVAALIFSCISFFILVRRGSIEWTFNPDLIKKGLSFGIPLIPFNLANLALTSLDRIFISHIIGLGSTGVYWVSMQVGYIVFLFAQEVMRAYFPPIFKKLKNLQEEDKKQIVKVTYMFFAAILAVATIVGYVSHHFLHLFLGPKFVSAGSLVVWIAIGQAFSGMQALLAQFILFDRKTSWLAALMSGAIFVQAGLCYLLINANGILGAAQATALLNLILLIVTWALTMRVFKLPWLTFCRAN